MFIRRLSRQAAAGRVFALLALGALTAAGCDEEFADPGQIDLSRARVVAVSGNHQSGFVDAPLPQPLRVQVLDARGNPVPRTRVEFEMLAGAGLLNGRPLSATGVTDFAGFTHVRFTPREEGEFVVQASQPAGGEEARVTFVMDAILFSRITNAAIVEKIGGDGQTGPVGTILPLPLTVRVSNEFGTQLENVPVVFTATTDGTLLVSANEGDFSQIDTLGNTPAATDSIGRQIVSFSDENGVAAALLRLRTRPGSNQVTASITFATGSNNAVTFNATGEVGGAGSASDLFKVAGDEQNVEIDTVGSGGVFQAPPFNPMVVQVTDRFGNPIPGVSVTFRISIGFGSLSNDTDVTDENGFAQTVFTAAPQFFGGFAVSATAPGVRFDPVQHVFQGSIGLVGMAPEEEEPEPPVPGAISKVSGDNQQLPFDGSAITFNAMVVSVTDGTGAPQAGVTVFFDVSSGVGTLSNDTDVTDATGRASTTFTSDPSYSGPVSVSAFAAGFGSVTFDGEVTPPPP